MIGVEVDPADQADGQTEAGHRAHEQGQGGARHTSFLGADLAEANFAGADLSDSTLFGAVLDGAAFDTAVMNNLRR
jgi:uncharacterized protein YjbI with pentapeptide repeats